MIVTVIVFVFLLTGRLVDVHYSCSCRVRLLFGEVDVVVLFPAACDGVDYCDVGDASAGGAMR